MHVERTWLAIGKHPSLRDRLTDFNEATGVSVLAFTRIVVILAEG
jgi:hypothetical protein